MRFTYSIPVFIGTVQKEHFHDKAKKRSLRLKNFKIIDIKNQKYMLPLQCSDLHKDGNSLKFW